LPRSPNQINQSSDYRSLDAIDYGILGALARDGRVSFVTLAGTVGLSPNAVAERVRRLEREGVIAGYHAQISPRAIGRPLVALVDLRLAPGTDPATFEELVPRVDSVREITFLTGRFDYQLLVACQDAAHLDRALRRLRSEAGVAETETRVVLRGPIRSRPVPNHD
jgi:Lrp/AsnC family leucine-responsive transcriptional regulator